MTTINQSWYKKPKDKNIPTQKLAGGIVVRNENGRLLVAMIGGRKYSDFMLPKGRIENGESALEAARREIKEEVGLDKLDLIKKLGIKERFTFDKTTWNTYHYFLFSTVQVSGMQKLGPDEQDYIVRWFDIDNLPSMFWPEQEDLILKNKDNIKKLLNLKS